MIFFEVEKFGIHSSIVAKTKNVGKKIISIIPISAESGEKFLISSNDEIKMVNSGNRATEVTYSSHTNTSSQVSIH